MSTRHDMLVELATDKVNQLEEMFREGEYDDIHRWLQPIFLAELKHDLAELSDDDLAAYYADQLGLDIPSSPPLSSSDEPNILEKENAKASW